MRITIILAACLLSAVLQAAEPEAAKPARKIDLAQFKLTFSDEFDGQELDTSKWQIPVMKRQGSSRWVKDLVSVKDGNLQLGIRLVDDPVFRYDCGAVRTRRNYDVNQTMFQQRYGYFETRCKLPANVAADYWAAFWLMAGRINDRVSDTREGTEIDIMETFTFGKTSEYKLAFHWNGYGKLHNAAGLNAGKQPQVLDGEYHTFGLYWDEHVYVAFLDGVEVGRTEMEGLGSDKDGKVKSQGPCREPAYLKLSCEAAPWSGKSHLWESKMPKEDVFLVDYVRVYEGKLK